MMWFALWTIIGIATDNIWMIGIGFMWWMLFDDD